MRRLRAFAPLPRFSFTLSLFDFPCNEFIHLPKRFHIKEKVTDYCHEGL